jgi:hypothetical protein
LPALSIALLDDAPYLPETCEPPVLIIAFSLLSGIPETLITTVELWFMLMLVAVPDSFSISLCLHSILTFLIRAGTLLRHYGLTWLAIAFKGAALSNLSRDLNHGANLVARHAIRPLILIEHNQLVVLVHYLMINSFNLLHCLIQIILTVC